MFPPQRGREEGQMAPVWPRWMDGDLLRQDLPLRLVGGPEMFTELAGSMGGERSRFWELEMVFSFPIRAGNLHAVSVSV